jgi:hypothetical protein
MSAQLGAIVFLLPIQQSSIQIFFSNDSNEWTGAALNLRMLLCLSWLLPQSDRSCPQERQTENRKAGDSTGPGDPESGNTTSDAHLS